MNAGRRRRSGERPRQARNHGTPRPEEAGSRGSALANAVCHARCARSRWDCRDWPGIRAAPRCARRNRERIQVVAVVAVWYPFEAATIAGDVIVEGRVAAKRRNRRLTRIEEDAHDESQQVVYSTADTMTLHTDAELARERPAQLVALRVAVEGHPRGGGAHGVARHWGRTKHTLVGAKPQSDRPTGGGARWPPGHERHGGGQTGDQAGKRRGITHRWRLPVFATIE